MRITNNKSLKTKRIVAYLLDIFIVLMLSNVLLNGIVDKKHQEDLVKDLGIKDITEIANLKDVTEEQKIIMYNYDRKTVKYNLVAYLIALIYYIIIPIINKGSTLGQKILNLRTVSDNLITGIIIRSHLIYASLYSFLPVIFIYQLSRVGYYTALGALTMIIGSFLMIEFFVYLLDKDNKGLHDYIAQTRVIEIGE